MHEIPGFTALSQGSTTLSFLKTKREKKYLFVHYEKEYMTLDLYPLYGLLHSLIFDDNGMLLSLAAPKSIPYDTFITSFPVPGDDIIIEEYIQGTYIQLFWDKRIGLTGGWEMATKNGIVKDSLRISILQAIKNYIHKMSNQYTYCFILRDNMSLFLVDIFEIVNNGPDILVFPIKREDIKVDGILFPVVYSPLSLYKDINAKYASMNTPPTIIGFVLRHTITQNITKRKSPLYEYTVSLKNYTRQDQYRYFVMRKYGLVSEYIKQYPKQKKVCAFFRNVLHKWMHQLYKNYRNQYILYLNDPPLAMFSIPLKQLHWMYLHIWKPQGDKITLQKVITYVHQMSPSYLMYCMNMQK